MIVTSVQIKTAKTQKHLYCLVFTEKALAFASAFSVLFALREFYCSAVIFGFAECYSLCEF